MVVIISGGSVFASNVNNDGKKRVDAFKVSARGVLPIVNNINKLSEIKLVKGNLVSDSVEYVDIQVPITDYVFLNHPSKKGSFLVVKRKHDFKITKINNEASLPFVVKTVDAPKNKECVGVELVSAEYATSFSKIKLLPIYGGQNQAKLKEYYSRSNYQPGSFVDFFSASNNDKQKVYLRLFPVQYIPSTGLVTVLTKARFAIHYRGSIL